MKITLSFDDKLARELGKIAVQQDSLAGLVRDDLEKVTTEKAAFAKKRRERRALDR